MSKRIVSIGLASAIAIALVWILLRSISVNDATSETLATVTVRQEWFPNSNYAGVVFASRQFARQNGIKIEIQNGSDVIDPIKLLLSNECMFVDVGADRVIDANQKGADLVVVGVLNNISPTVLIAREEKNIRTPFDFVGKKVGVLTGTNTEYVYRSLLAKLKIEKSSFNELEVPFDLGTFVAGEYDVRPAFIYDEPVSLELKNIRYTIIRPQNYGVSFMGTVYAAKRSLVAQKPELVQKFISSVARGWTATLRYPDQAIAYLKEYDPTLDVNREKLALTRSQYIFAGYNGQVLRGDPRAWAETVENLKALGVVRDPEKNNPFEMRFVDQYHQAPK